MDKNPPDKFASNLSEEELIKLQEHPISDENLIDKQISSAIEFDSQQNIG